MTLSLEFWSRKFVHNALKLLCILNDDIIRFESNLNLCYNSKLENCTPCYQNHGFFFYWIYAIIKFVSECI